MNGPAAILVQELRDWVWEAAPVHRPRKVQARPVTHPQALHHATVARGVHGMPAGWTARMLVLRRSDGSVEIYAPLLAYMRDHPFRSATWQNEHARALGLFWDYSLAVGASTVGGKGIAMLQSHFRSFALALSRGTITEGRDPLGLYWPSSSRAVAMRSIRRIEDFARWCAVRFDGDEKSNPISPPSNGLNFTDVLVWSRLRGIRMLDHLATEPQPVRRRSVVDLGPSPGGHGLEAVKFFPRQHSGRLIWEGHRRPGAKPGADIYGQHNLRDQMMALLDGWGGLRQSEGLHLWTSDVRENPEKPGHALVVLHHPAESLVQYVDPISRRLVTGSRAEALDRVYGLRPRNQVTRGRYHVGWKGMDLDRHHRTLVHWLDDDAATLFWTLYLAYLSLVRKPVMALRRSLGGKDHPFLLVSEREDRSQGDTGMVGSPYSIQAYERNHRAAVGQLGLPYGKEHGTTTHGLRHMYGRTLADLKVQPGIIRKAMHHVSHLSQLVYVAPDNAATDASLREGWDRLVAAHLEQSAPGSRVRSLAPQALADDTTRALLRLKASIKGGGELA